MAEGIITRRGGSEKVTIDGQKVKNKLSLETGEGLFWKQTGQALLPEPYINTPEYFPFIGDNERFTTVFSRTDWGVLKWSATKYENGVVTYVNLNDKIQDLSINKGQFGYQNGVWYGVVYSNSKAIFYKSTNLSNWVKIKEYKQYELIPSNNKWSVNNKTVFISSKNGTLFCILMGVSIFTIKNGSVEYKYTTNNLVLGSPFSQGGYTDEIICLASGGKIIRLDESMERDMGTYEDVAHNTFPIKLNEQPHLFNPTKWILHKVNNSSLTKISIPSKPSSLSSPYIPFFIAYKDKIILIGGTSGNYKLHEVTPGGGCIVRKIHAPNNSMENFIAIEDKVCVGFSNQYYGKLINYYEEV